MRSHQKVSKIFSHILGAGKTHTMVGTPEHPGCMARALNELFHTMEENTEAVFKVTMSYLEIYNENIRDLLCPSSGHLELRDDSKGRNITVAGLSEVTTKNTDEVMDNIPLHCIQNNPSRVYHAYLMNVCFALTLVYYSS